MPARTGAALEAGLILLLAFAVLAFGGTSYWARAAIQLGAAALFLTWWLVTARHRLPEEFEAGAGLPGIDRGGVRFRPTGLGIPAAAMLALVALQLVPLPGALRGVIAPGQAVLQAPLGAVLPGSGPAGPAAAGWSPLSLDLGATLDAALLGLGYAALFLFVVNFADSRERLVRIARGVVGLGAIVALVGLAQDLSGTVRIYGLKSPRFGGAPYGPFVNHNHFAGFIEMTLPLAFGLLLRRLLRPSAPRRSAAAGEPSGPGSAARRILGDDSSPLAERAGQALLLGLATALMLAALLRSLSRGGLASLGLATAAVLLLLALGGRLSRWEVSALVLVAAAGLFLFLWIGPETALEHFRRAEDLQNEPSFIGRVQVWGATLGIFRGFPVFGSGLGTFPVAFLHHYPAGTEKLWLQAHNDYVQVLAETGLVGALIAGAALVLFLLRLLGALAGPLRVRERHVFYGLCVGILAVLAHSLVDFNLQIPANAALFVVLAGLAVAQATALRRPTGAGGD